MGKRRLILIGSLLILGGILGYFGIIQWRINHAIVQVTLTDSLEVEVYQKVTVKDFINKLNGTLIKNKTIDTSKIGKQTISFEYRNEQNMKVPYQFTISVVDKTAPLIWLSDRYTITTDYEGDLVNSIMCGDNYDDHPNCMIEGSYDPKKSGEYSLIYKATDQSQNQSEQPFTLIIKEPTTSPKQAQTTLPLEEVIAEYKTQDVKIGIDISHWQGNIDFEKVKNAGVEFVFIRVGSQKGSDGAYTLDKKFIENIEGFQQVGLPIGIYYYSYAKSKQHAKKEAQWVLAQIKNYPVVLPVVFDWENWSFYQEFGLSFYHLNELSETFMQTIEKAGYQSMLYGSKNYLEEIWTTSRPVWLAHYTKQTDYQGSYQIWQRCENGQVDGIEGTVDINIMYP